jgi:UDP-N-acetylmuramoyl-L-alanyl-D-glutamate--2,6-diaminopimelate ligase
MPSVRIRPRHPAEHRQGELVSQFALLPAPGTVPGIAAVTGVVSDNRVVQPGDLFVALPGAHAHGVRFAADAIARGAVAVLTDEAGAVIAGAGIAPLFVCADPRAILGPLAACVYGEPAGAMTTFAVTGTNGKTTTAYQIEHLLCALGQVTGMVGTVETRIAGHSTEATLTTPEAGDLQALLAVMRESGVTACVMEASSHALAQHRVDGIVFDVAGFTNLSQDHLDFHGDMASYFGAKARLFEAEHARRGVIIVDDDWGVRMARTARIPVTTLRTRPAPASVPGQGWSVTAVTPFATGSAFTLTHADGRRISTSTTLPGHFNVANAALALVMVVESGVSLGDVARALDATGALAATVPGRMEVVHPGSARRPRVIVDFAHNTDALTLAMAALRTTTAGRLVVVFGATGDRDAVKRPAMAGAAVAGADVVYITDDDPHGEDAGSIRETLMDAARHAATLSASASDGRLVAVAEVAPRADAIRQAIATSRPGDTVLIAGRGHETIQDVAGVGIVLDDRACARQALAERNG